MQFNSLNFALFLPIVFALYWGVCRTVRWQNVLIVVASYVFYGMWSWRCLSLIMFTTVVSYASGLAIERWRRHGKAISAANLVVNLGILGMYKYYGFFAAELGLPGLNLVLPVGISFYTFQALSYSIDVYRGRLAATKDPVSFFAYISFFPQLVAGPIERATSLLPQFDTGQPTARRRFDEAEAIDGLRQMLWGLFKKVVMADNCARVVNSAWAAHDEASGLCLAVAAVCFSLQIYGDFSGYSDMAIGMARLFGIRLKRNFRFPYFARDIADFWRRWHISLTTWFRDYLYFPLGGSRGTKVQTVRNTFIIFLVSGLWHGANWTYIAWGAFHAVLFMPLLLLGRNRKRLDDEPCLRDLPLILLTFALSTLGWIIFRADSLGQAWSVVCRIFTLADGQWGHVMPSSRMALGVLLLCVEWVQRRKEHALEDIWRLPLLGRKPLRWAVYVAIALTCIFSRGVQVTFIYFQF